MATEARKLTDSEIAFVKEQARLLAADLAFYARGPVRLHLIGGDGYAFTIDAGGDKNFIDVYLNPKVLFDINNRERAIAVWRGMGFHELAHHLWPAKDQYDQALKEGFKDLFNLIDDEQNERRGRSQDPSWGACFQTTVAWVFRKKGKPKGGYVGRFNEFAYHFRRNLPGASDPVVGEALALIPRNLKDLSKPELLDLTRSVHQVLARGVDVPSEVPFEGKHDDGHEEDKRADPGLPASGGKPAPEPPVSLPAPPSIWRALFTSVWSYVVFAVFVATWLYFFGRNGFSGWDDTFWILLFASLGVLGVAAFMIWIEHLRNKHAVKWGRTMSKPGRLETIKKAVADGFDRAKGALGRLRQATGAALETCERKLPAPLKPVYRLARSAVRLVIAFARAVVAVVAGLVMAIWWLLKAGWWLLTACWSGLKWLGRTLWRSKIFRMAILAAPMAALIAMAIALILKSAWQQLLILLLILLLLLLLAWLFRKKIKKFIQQAIPGDEDGGLAGKDFDHSQEVLEFAVIDNIVPIEANEAVLPSMLADVAPLAQQMRPYFEKCGLVAVDLDDQETGHELVEDLERVAMGETAICVDEEKRPRASVHIELLIDCSGSMQGKKIELAKRFGLLVEESIRGVRGISAHIWGFTDRTIYDCGEPGQYRVSGLNAGGGNNDSGALWHAAQHAARSGKDLKILLMVSDGAPTECTWGSLNNLVLRLEAEGYIPVQVAVDRIDDPAFKTYFVDLVGQPMAAAVFHFGQMLLSLVESQR